MSLNGFQYYWLISLGLVGGLILGVPIGLYADEINSSSPILKISVVLLLAYPLICYFTVLLEIWHRFHFKAVLVVLGFIAATVLIHPIFSIVFAIGPTVYWFFRIGGISRGSR